MWRSTDPSSSHVTPILLNPSPTWPLSPRETRVECRRRKTQRSPILNYQVSTACLARHRCRTGATQRIAKIAESWDPCKSLLSPPSLPSHHPIVADKASRSQRYCARCTCISVQNNRTRRTCQSTRATSQRSRREARHHNQRRVECATSSWPSTSPVPSKPIRARLLQPGPRRQQQQRRHISGGTQSFRSAIRKPVDRDSWQELVTPSFQSNISTTTVERWNSRLAVFAIGTSEPCYAHRAHRSQRLLRYVLCESRIPDAERVWFAQWIDTWWWWLYVPGPKSQLPGFIQFSSIRWRNT